jgi:hypothetical protein
VILIKIHLNENNKIITNINNIILKKKSFSDSKDNEVKFEVEISDEAPVAFTIPSNEKPRFRKETLLHCKRVPPERIAKL